MYILLNIFLVVLINDYISYFLNIKYIFSIIASLIITGLFNLLIRKKIRISHDIEKSDLIFYILLFLIMIITIPYADRAFDSFNYHLYLQKNPFGDKLGYDFFAGKNFNTYTYAFADRVFYLFRYFLGYRPGLILNYFLLIVLYYQVKRILSHILKGKINKNVLAIFSSFSILSLSIVDIVDSYYIDILSIVVLLEAFSFSMFSESLKKEDKNNFLKFGYLALLFGLGFSIKISNAIPIIFIFIIYIFNHRNVFRCLNIKNILTTLIIFLLPFIIYMIYTFIQTGNPVFPFYNTIFKSKFFVQRNWLDTRFGPSRFLEVLIWPILILIYPNRCVDTSIVEPMWCYGYVISIIYILYYGFMKLKNRNYKLNRDKVLFFISVFLFYIIWSKFMLGYSRYGLIVLVLGSITTCIFIYDIIVNKKIILLSIMIPLILYNLSYCAGNYMYKEQDWIFNNYFNSRGEYKYNLKNIFSRDAEKMELEENSVWAVVYNNSGLLQELNSNIPMINLSELGSSHSEYKNDYTIDLIRDKLSKFDYIYTAVDTVDYNNLISSLNEFGFKIIEVKKVLNNTTLPRKNYYVYVFKIKYVGKVTNEFVSFNMSKQFKLQKCTNNKISLFIGTCNNLNNVFFEDFKVSVYAYNGDSKEKISEMNINHDGSVHKYEFNINTEKYDSLELKVENLDGEEDPNLWVTLLNYESICE